MGGMDLGMPSLLDRGNTMPKTLDYELQQTSAKEQIKNREDLKQLFTTSPIPLDHLMVNLQFYMRSSVLAKVLYIDELYRKIVNLPGSIFEFGAWYGSNLVLFENLRAIYDPYNYTRKVVGFDTFEGYANLSRNDGNSDLVKQNQYSVPNNYIEHLEKNLKYHQKENSLPHKNKVELVRGEASQTIVQYLTDNPHTMISLAYFDMQLYEPTKECLKAIKPYLIKGAIIALDEINNDDFPGETIAFREVFGLDNFEIYKSVYLPDRSYMIYG